MSEPLVRVECYSGFKAEERPLRIVFASQTLEIIEIEDRWYSPGARYFRVRTESGDRYVLRQEEAQAVWSLTAFRSAGNRVDTKINRSV